MTEDELSDFLQACPTLYHMAEAGSWPSIRRHGLLSASALLDLFGVEGPERVALEAAQRPDSRSLHGADQGRAVLRDNKPIKDSSLAGLLDDELTPTDWYRMLNARVFFWPSKERLFTLMKAYPGQVHDVLEVDSAALVAAHRDDITLSAINSGAIGQARMRRGSRTFRSIEDYDHAGRRKLPRSKRVAELTVLGGVSDIARFTRRVVRMREEREEGVVWERDA